MTSHFPAAAAAGGTSHKVIRCITVLGLLLLLPSCSTGSVNSGSGGSPPTTGSLQKPASLESAATADAGARKDEPSCRQLAEPIEIELVRLNSAPEALRAEAEQTPQTLSALFARSSDPIGNLSTYKDYTESRARLEAANKEVAAAGCPPVDISERLAKTDKLLTSGLWRYGTEAEAKSMLSVAFADLAREQEKTIRRIQAGWEPFKARDVNVSCADRGTGLIVTSRSGREKLADLKDAKQGQLGANLARAATGTSAATPKEVTFAAILPGGKAEVTRVAFVAQNDDLICWASAIRG